MRFELLEAPGVGLQLAVHLTLFDYKRRMNIFIFKAQIENEPAQLSADNYRPNAAVRVMGVI